MRGGGEALHLRLVGSNSETRPSVVGTAIRRHEQFSFPYPETSSVFFLRADTVAPTAFTRILAENTPRWVIDVRVVPRFDSVAGSRASAFRLFENYKATYIDLFGRIGIRSYRSVEANPALWAKTIQNLLTESGRKGPYLFLFDNQDIMVSADRVLRQVMSQIAGSSARFSNITH
jgi:hypothetical protein